MRVYYYTCEILGQVEILFYKIRIYRFGFFNISSNDTPMLPPSDGWLVSDGLAMYVCLHLQFQPSVYPDPDSESRLRPSHIVKPSTKKVQQ